MTAALYEYVISHCDLPHPYLTTVISETANRKDAVMQISCDQSAFMHMLTKLIGAKRVLEIGCYTGMSAISMASALPEDGKLISLDYDPEVVAIARQHFANAGLSDKVDTLIGPALENLPKVLKDFGPGSFDLAFIDADKEQVQSYFEACLALLRTNGLLIVDNVMWSGKVLDANESHPATVALKAFNERIMKDPRVERVFLHISDGLFLLRKVGSVT